MTVRQLIFGYGYQFLRLFAGLTALIEIFFLAISLIFFSLNGMGCLANTGFPKEAFLSFCGFSLFHLSGFLGGWLIAKR